MHFPSPTSFSSCISATLDFTQDESPFFTTIYLNTFLMCHSSERLLSVGSSGNTEEVFPPYRTHHQQYSSPVTLSETFSQRDHV